VDCDVSDVDGTLGFDSDVVEDVAVMNTDVEVDAATDDVLNDDTVNGLVDLSFDIDDAAAAAGVSLPPSSLLFLRK